MFSGASLNNALYQDQQEALYKLQTQQMAWLHGIKRKTRKGKIIDMEYDLQRYLNRHETITFNRVY